MQNSAYIPQRGDLVWLDFDPQTGREQAGRRPALVLSDKRYNARSDLAILCPITSQSKPYPFFVALPNGTLSKPSFVIADQVGSFDWRSRNISFIGVAPHTTLEQVSELCSGIIQGR